MKDETSVKWKVKLIFRGARNRSDWPRPPAPYFTTDLRHCLRRHGPRIYTDQGPHIGKSGIGIHCSKYM